MNAAECEKNIADNIEYYMALRDRTQAQMCRETGTAVATMNRWVRGISCPSVQDMGRLADYFGIGVEDLILPRSESTGNISLRAAVYCDFIRSVFGAEIPRSEMTDERADRIDALMSAVLPDTENTVVRKTHGLDMDGHYPFAAIGRDFGCSREYIRQIYKTALETLSAWRDAFLSDKGTNAVDIYSMPIAGIRNILGPRAYKAVHNDGTVRTVADLMAADDGDFLKMNRIGPTALEHINHAKELIGGNAA